VWFNLQRRIPLRHLEKLSSRRSMRVALGFSPLRNGVAWFALQCEQIQYSANGKKCTTMRPLLDFVGRLLIRLLLLGGIALGVAPIWTGIGSRGMGECGLVYCDDLVYSLQSKQVIGLKSLFVLCNEEGGFGLQLYTTYIKIQNPGGGCNLRTSWDGPGVGIMEVVGSFDLVFAEFPVDIVVTSGGYKLDASFFPFGDTLNTLLRLV